jgi:NADH:ubiquinone oxidoreductase subunit C
MTDEALERFITETLPSFTVEFSRPAPRRMFLRIRKENALEVFRLLKEKAGIYHLSTLTGLDAGENFDLWYHLAYPNGCLTVRYFVPRTEARAPSICAVYPGPSSMNGKSRIC